jgi:hypothetical protein
MVDSDVPQTVLNVGGTTTAAGARMPGTATLNVYVEAAHTPVAQSKASKTERRFIFYGKIFRNYLV